jgi:hypothetical protein
LPVTSGTYRDRDVRFNVSELGTDIVVDVVKLAALHVKAIAALDIADGEQRSFSATSREFSTLAPAAGGTICVPG